VFTQSNPQLTMRIACSGGGTADLVNAAPVSELHVNSCASMDVVFGSAFVGTAADRTIHVAVSPNTSWQLAVWAG
jgi:hypothetical protein